MLKAQTKQHANSLEIGLEKMDSTEQWPNTRGGIRSVDTEVAAEKLIESSYKKAECCNNCDCYLYECYYNQPCWGRVTVVGEEYTEDDHWWIHACKGHEETWDGGEYINEYLTE